MSGIVLPIALALTVLFIYEAATTRAGIWLAEAVVAAAVTVIAAVDLLMIRRRARQRGRS